LSERSEKRQIVWDEMLKLEQLGIGKRVFVSVLRDKFVLNVEFPNVERLTKDPKANGFVRADQHSLLFRYASEELRRKLEIPEHLISVTKKGLQLRWSVLDEMKIHRLFYVIRTLASPSTPIDRAKAYVFNLVLMPALNRSLPEEIKNKVQNAHTWLSKFERVGDLYAYLSLFRTENGGMTYLAMKANNLFTFEDILDGFESQFSPWCNDRTRTTDFVEGREYSEFQILIFANAYDARAGDMFVISAENKPAYVVIKATLDSGMNPNEWIEVGVHLKYYLKSINGDFGEEFKPDPAILNNPDVPILTFVRKTSDEDFTYFGTFENEKLIRAEGGAKYFTLRRKGLASDSLILSDHLETNFKHAVKLSIELGRERRLARLAAAPKKPTKVNTITAAYVRNPDVVAEVLFRANGKCEKCLSPAPFDRRSDGSPYLEVHHVKQLALGGEDTVENAIGLCPNCHRKSHYG
jgi:5-methylcytosine-specific restriction enzyme A